MKGTYIFLADGFEDIEALAVRDVLLRGGAQVTLVSIGEDCEVVSSHGLHVLADCTLSELSSRDTDACGIGSSRDFMIFPGGMPGSRNLGSCGELVRMMQDHYASGGSLAAICAAPSFVLGHLEGLSGTDFTCYEGCEGALLEKGWSFVRKACVHSGRIVTGRGPGHALEFGLEILRSIAGLEVAESVRSAMVLPVE